MKNNDLKGVFVDLKKCTDEQIKLIFSLLPDKYRDEYYSIYNHDTRLHNFIDELFCFISENHAKTFGIIEVDFKEYIKIFKKTDFSIITRGKEPKSGFYFC